MPAPSIFSFSKHEAVILALLGICLRQQQAIGQLTQERAQLEEKNRVLIAERDHLKQQSEELNRRLGLDSGNSSRPPSSDGLKRKRRTASSPERERRKRLGRRPGKQKGAAGRHLLPVANPDRVLELLPSFCEKCSASLLEPAGEEGMEKRQVLDLPPPPGLEATEYRALRLRCRDCGHVTKAAFPQWAQAPVQYGPQLHAMVSYLAVHQHLPYERMAELLRDVYGVEVSAGALVTMVARGGERVGPAVAEIQRQLQAAEVAHLDETGAHVNGKLKWVHGAATDRLALLGIADQRGSEGMKVLGVAEGFTGIAIHDSWSSYWSPALGKVKGHGLCNAHHLRELAAVTELDGQRWSGRMSDLLLEMLDTRNAAMRAGQSALEPTTITELEQRYERIIGAGWRENPGQRQRRRLSKAANLLRRLDERRPEVLRFLHDFRVPFTNNEIERDLRMTKLHEKISGGWRSMEGARAFLALRSYLTTARKQGQGMLEVLVGAFEGRPWLPAAAGP